MAGDLSIDFAELPTLPPSQRQAAAPVLFGRYELLGEVASGGMGALYLARLRMSEGISREVALKIVRADFLAQTPAARKMFVDEARLLARIVHSNVVQILDVGEERGTPFMVMEYLRGITLLRLTAQMAERNVPFAPDLASALVAQACRGLHAAHELRDELGNPLGLVHRDVSPHNLMILPDGDVKVIDFGVAWAADRLVEPTQAGRIKGKLAYLSPEQARAQSLDRRSDIFSVGTILYELLSGTRLFRRDNETATVLAIIAADVRPLHEIAPSVPRRLSDIVMQSLSADPARRPPTAAALADELEAMQQSNARFPSRASIGAHLASLGLDLLGAPPQAIERAPWVLASSDDKVDISPLAMARTDELAAGGAPMMALKATAKRPSPLSGETLAAPRAGERDARLLSDGRRIVLQSIRLDDSYRIEPAAVHFDGAPALLPVRLLLTPQIGGLLIEAERATTGGGAPRSSLYRRAEEPSTRCESFLVPPAATSFQFDVGHRKTRVLRVHCASSIDIPPSSIERPRVQLPALSLFIVAAEPAARLVCLYGFEGDPGAGAVHVICAIIA